MTTLSMAALLTFCNPHVYLDTVVLIGTVSLQFEGAAKIAFVAGAITASFTFFTGLDIVQWHCQELCKVKMRGA